MYLAYRHLIGIILRLDGFRANSLPFGWRTRATATACKRFYLERIISGTIFFQGKKRVREQNRLRPKTACRHTRFAAYLFNGTAISNITGSTRCVLTFAGVQCRSDPHSNRYSVHPTTTEVQRRLPRAGRRMRATRAPTVYRYQQHLRSSVRRRRRLTFTNHSSVQPSVRPPAVCLRSCCYRRHTTAVDLSSRSRITHADDHGKYGVIAESFVDCVGRTLPCLCHRTGAVRTPSYQYLLCLYTLVRLSRHDVALFSAAVVLATALVFSVRLCRLYVQSTQRLFEGLLERILLGRRFLPNLQCKCYCIELH